MTNRRQYLAALGALGVTCVAGCSQDGSTQRTATDTTPTDTGVEIDASPEMRLNDTLPEGFENGGATRVESDDAIGDYVWRFDRSYILSDYAWGPTDHDGTLCSWVYIPGSETDTDGFRGIVSAHDGGRDGDYEFEQLSLRQAADGDGVGIFKNKLDADSRGAFTTDYPTDEWFHLAGVVDKADGELRTYIDGQQRAAATDYDITMEQEGNFGIGARAKHRFGEYEYVQRFVGRLDDVRIYSTALSDTEIRSLAGQ